MGEISLQSAYELMRQAVSSGEHEKVAGIALHVLQYFPQNLKAKLYLGEAYVAAGRLPEACDVLREVCASDPENVVAQVGLSGIAERQNQLTQAITHLEQAIEMRPDMADLRTRLVNLYRRSARNDVYLQLSRVGLARLFVRGRMFEQAIDEFRQLVEAQPQRIDIAVALIEALWRYGDESEAVKRSEELLEEHPTTLKAHLIVAQYYTGRNSEKSETHWQAAEAYDPLYETATELFGGSTLPDIGEWQLPAWDDVAWYQNHLRQSADSGIRVKYLSNEATPSIGDVVVDDVLHEMRQGHHGHHHDHDEDCVCMAADESAPDSTGMLLQRTLDRQAELQRVGATPVANQREGVSTPLKTQELDPEEVPVVDAPVVIERSTMPVEPDVDETATEPVHMNPGIAIPFKVPTVADADDVFLASALQATDLGGDDDVDNKAVAVADVVPTVRRIDTTLLRTLTCSDDLYAVLAKLELQQVPSETEDLRDVVARALGGGVIERARGTPVRPVPRHEQRILQQATHATLESLLEQKQPVTAVEVPSGGHDLLANLLAQPQSGLTEGMRGLSAALPRVDHDTLTAHAAKVQSDHDTLTMLLNEQMAAQSQKKHAQPDTPLDVTLQAMLEQAPVDDAPQKMSIDGLSVSSGMRLGDFPEATSPNQAINGEQVLRSLGVSTGEMAQVATGPLGMEPKQTVSRGEVPITPVVNHVLSDATSAQTARAQHLAALIPESLPAIAPQQSGNEAMDGYLRALHDDPENMVLRLSVARVAMQCRMFETAIQQYKYLIRASALLEDVVNDLRDLIGEIDESFMRRECSLLLGNAYARQGKVQQAVEVYSMTHNRGRAVIE
jgi:tetratricopeptide (TPR) repeat protein